MNVYMHLLVSVYVYDSQLTGSDSTIPVLKY